MVDFLCSIFSLKKLNEFKETNLSYLRHSRNKKTYFTHQYAILKLDFCILSKKEGSCVK